MKKLSILFGCVIVFLAATTQSSIAGPQGSVGVSFNVFYDALSPHGEWISVGSGVYGWRPAHVETGWRPYTVGRWCWTDDGWYWVSDEPWGWAAYHYGRWYYDEYNGWMWIPGYDWAPAWVEWRYGDDYFGWAPLSPYAVFSVNWGIHYRTRWNTPHHWWSFAGCRYMTSPNIHKYVYRTDHNSRYIGVTRSGGSVRYSGGRIVSRGPEREYVERRGSVRIEPVRIREVGDRREDRIVREGDREQIDVFRPRIEERNADDSNSGRPSHVREGRGRAPDLDTRKIDVRAREVQREEGRDIRRAEEVRTREEVGRGGSERGELQGRQQDSRNSERVRPQGMPEPQPRSEPRERKREENSVRPQRQESRSPNPERRQEVRSPVRRMETPTRRTDSQGSTPRSSGGGKRSEGGRSGRSR